MEYNREDIRQIAFEKIDNRFSKSKYLGIEVTIDMTNGYINGPHLVGQVNTKGGKPKQFNSWRRSKEAKNIMEYVSTVEGINSCNLIGDIMDVAVGLRGAYIHPLLVLTVANWASPAFAYKINKVLLHIAIYYLELSGLVSWVPNIVTPRIGCVYFVSNGRYTKIGQTCDLKRRLVSLQTANPDDLEVWGTINCLHSEILEKTIHDNMIDYHVRGEWYDITRERVDELMSKYSE